MDLKSIYSRILIQKDTISYYLDIVKVNHYKYRKKNNIHKDAKL